MVIYIFTIISIAIAPMIQSARAAITNTGNEQAQVEFSQKSDNVSIACSITVLSLLSLTTYCVYF